MTLDGKTVEVKATLWSFLLNLCKLGHGGLVWIDVLSINQQNVEERNAQVSMMGKIFKEAQCVYAWVGDSDPYIDYAFILAQCASLLAFSKLERAQRDRLVATATIGFQNLDNRQFWARVWTIQEVALAKVLFLVCGGQTIEWRLLVHARTELSTTAGQRTIHAEDEAQDKPRLSRFAPFNDTRILRLEAKSREAQIC